MKTCIQKWGNSLAVRIPKSFAVGLGFADGSPAEISLEDGAIVVRPDRDKFWVLGDLLADVADDNLHPVWDTGAAAGAFKDTVRHGDQRRQRGGNRAGGDSEDL